MKALLEKKKASGKFVYGNDGDIFVFAFTQGEVDAGMKALKEGNGFSTNENFKSASKDSKSNLGYVYIEMGDVVKNFLASSSAKGSDTKSLEEVKAQIGTLKNVYFDLVAKDDGFEFGGLGNLSDDKDLIAKMMPYFGKKLSLFDKVPLENPILYMELPNVGQYIASFVAGFRGSSGAGGVADLQKDYDDFLTLVSGFGGISKDEAKGIFESPFAFAVGDSWEKYPTVAFYFDVDAKYADAAKKFVGALDAYADAVVKEFEGMMGVSGVLNKTAAVLKGGGIYKLYIDFKNVPDQLLSNFALMPGFDVKKTKLEFYYGLTGDNVLSVALYPQFDKVYGEKTVSKDKYVSEAIKDKTSFFTFFLSPEKLINFVDTNYYKMAKDNGILVADYAKYYALAKDTMQVLRYFVSSYSMPRNDKILFNSFLKFQEVKKNEALEKVKEGK